MAKAERPKPLPYRVGHKVVATIELGGRARQMEGTVTGLNRAAGYVMVRLTDTTQRKIKLDKVEAAGG